MHGADKRLADVGQTEVENVGVRLAQVGHERGQLHAVGREAPAADEVSHGKKRGSIYAVLIAHIAHGAVAETEWNVEAVEDKQNLIVVLDHIPHSVGDRISD